MDVVIPLTIGIIFWFLSLFKYKYGNFISWNESQPRFVLFLKYEAKYSGSNEQLRSDLVNLGFSESDSDSNLFKRGKIYGDFSANKIRLNILVDPTTQSLKLFCPSMILFDTGDLWKLTKSIVQTKP